MKSIRILLGLVLLAAAAAGGFQFTGRMLAATAPSSGGQRGGDGAVVVETQPSQTLTFSETVEAIGTTLALQSVTLRPSASGRVVKVAFAAGDRVEPGDVLLRLDDAAARAALASAEATVAEAQAAYDRQSRLEKLGSAAEATLQSARAALLRSQAERDMAINALEDRELEAPFGGVVGLSDISLGQLVDSSTEITTLDDLSAVEVAFSVPERFMARLAKGQQVQLVSPAYPGETFTGTIRAMDTRVDQGTRSIALRAKVPNDDRRLTAGMFMRVSLVLGQRQAQAVPERALTVAGAQSFVHVVSDGIAHRIEVTIGSQQDGMVEIAGDLPAGAPVVVTNLHRLGDGTAVTVADAGPVDEAQP
ncbi:MAG: efflux transporter periplasmic adaptor subunit [Rhodobacteraceae bacterium]|nr:efflux transporter periplasmic adaptor subunit [Paracoccaceae bacterium]